MEAMSQFAKRLGVFFMALFMASACLFSAPKEADAGEVEIMGAFGYAALPDSDSKVDYNGLAFSVGVGYRFISWVGVALEQDLGGLFYNKNHADIDCFYGATMFEVKFNIGLLGNLELSGKAGIGAVYVADSFDYGDGKKRFDRGWFAIRVGVGLTYYLFGTVGLGLNFDYTPAIGNDDDDFFVDDSTQHFLKLQAHVAIKF